MRKTYSLAQADETRVSANRIEPRLDVEIGHPARAFVARLLQRSEGSIEISEAEMDDRAVVSGNIAAGSELVQLVENLRRLVTLAIVRQRMCERSGSERDRRSSSARLAKFVDRFRPLSLQL